MRGKLTSGRVQELAAKLVPLSQELIFVLDNLWQEHWSHEASLPGLQNRVIDAVATNESNRVIGYGQVKLFAEAQLFLDPTTRRRDRALATKLLMHEAFRGAEKAGLKDIYCFIRNPDFSLLIEKHFGFERVLDPGELLLRRI